MQQSKLILLFRHFSAEELNSFEHFLLSPYFNQSEKLLKFFRAIKPYHPSFDSKKLEKEKVYKTLHSKSVYNDSTMRELISELLKLAKVFLANEELRKNKLRASEMRYNWLSERRVEKLLEAEVEMQGLLLDEQIQHNNFYYYYRRLNDLHKFEIASDRFWAAEHKLIKDFDLDAHVNSLNRDYLVNSLAYNVYLLSLASVYKFPVREELLRPVELLAAQYIKKGDSVIDLFYGVFQVVRTADEKYFYELKSRYLENDRSVPDAVMAEVSSALSNYCAKKIREGKEHFATEIMEVYRF